MDKRLILSIAFLLLCSSMALAASAPTITISKPLTGSSLDKSEQLKFTISDDNAQNSFDVNWAYRKQGTATWTVIVTDADLNNAAVITCDDYNFQSATRTCTYSWDLSALAPGTYDFNVQVWDSNALNTPYVVANDVNTVYVNLTKINDGGVCGMLNIFAIVIAAVVLIGAVFAFYGLGRTGNLTNDVMGLVIAGCVLIVGIVVFLILYSTFCY